jgi:DNA-binding transcriptional LysR family regulator
MWIGLLPEGQAVGEKRRRLRRIRIAAGRLYEKSIVYINVIIMTNLASFDLNLLRVLDALLKERSTVRAGQRIGLSQPAVSAALKRLRGALGDELFFRRGQRMEPTSQALSLAGPLQEVLDGIEALISPAKDFDPRTSTAGFRISGSDFFAELLMPRLADQLQALGPAICVHLVDLQPRNPLLVLEQTDMDLALIPGKDFPDWVEHQRAFRSSFSVVARADHPRLVRAGLRSGEIIPIDLFCDLGHAVFSQEGRKGAMGDAALARVGRSRRVAMTLPVFSGVYRAVAGSDLVAILPTPLARHVAKTHGLEVFLPPMPLEPAAIAMVWHRRNSANPAHRWFREQVAGLLSKLDDPAVD